jgi:RNA polymerase sigma factor for flagellar operon FliA
VPLNEFQVLLGTIRSLTITDFGDDDESETGQKAIQQIPDDPSRSPLACYEQTELQEHLARSLDQLPERERNVIALYYLEELTLKEIGAVLGITESRVCQIHTQAIIHLRTLLNPKKGEPTASSSSKAVSRPR